VVEVVVDAVGNGSIVVERGKHLANGDRDLFDATDDEECLLLSGEGGIRQIFGLALDRTANIRRRRNPRSAGRTQLGCQP
jgi:hypothetical protein